MLGTYQMMNLLLPAKALMNLLIYLGLKLTFVYLGGLSGVTHLPCTVSGRAGQEPSAESHGPWPRLSSSVSTVLGTSRQGA